MARKSQWAVVGAPVDPDTTEALFFTEHEWATVEAATARIMPTDHQPGAREARVVVFIDRYLSGPDHVYAAADGSGFLQMTGQHAAAWRARQADMARTYRDGLAELDRVSNAGLGADFVDLDEDKQDRALELLSGMPKPAAVTLGTVEPVTTFLQGTFDEGLGFFEALCLHTRQGFYSDPVYGGNKDRVGWQVAGFPGPASLADTMDGTYDTHDWFAETWDWHDLIPHLAVVEASEVEQ